MAQNKILILDFGGQYNQLIARRVRECNVYSEVRGFESTTLEDIKAFDPKGIIFTGGPQSAYGEGAPSIDAGVFELGVPIMGICYGAQLMAYMLGGKIDSAPTSEYGRADVVIDDKGGILKSADDVNVCWMSHTDYISRPPEGFVVTAHTDHCPVAGMEDRKRGFYGVQFHPEVNHRTRCRVHPGFRAGRMQMRSGLEDEFLRRKQIEELRERSATERCYWHCPAAWTPASLQDFIQAIGKQLTCVFVITACSVRTRRKSCCRVRTRKDRSILISSAWMRNSVTTINGPA